MNEPLHIVGGGMAGSEAAWQAAQMGVPVVLHEMRPEVGTFAHRTGHFAEMVCSNSFRSDDDERNAVGLLHWEMRAAGGLIMEMADGAPPAGRRRAGGGPRSLCRRGDRAAAGASADLHVDYDEVAELPSGGDWIIATGPLTSARAGARHPRRDRGRGAGLLRRHRAHRLCRQRRHVGGLDAVAL